MSTQIPKAKQVDKELHIYGLWYDLARDQTHSLSFALFHSTTELQTYKSGLHFINPLKFINALF